MARFGKQDTVGLDTNAPGGSGRAVFTRFELTEAGTLNHVAIYSTGVNAGLVKGLVYADNAGEPGAQVAVGAPVAVVQNDWAVSECSGEALTPGLYWIGVISQDYLSSMRVASSGGTGWVQWGDSGYDNPPDPWSGGSAAGYILGAYADYDPGGGPPDGAIEGTAALAFTVAGAVDQPPPGPIAGSTGLSLSASAAPTLPPSPAPTFAGQTANGTLTNGSRRLIHNGGAGGVANCIASEPIVGKQYFETLQHIEVAGSLPHGSVYGDTDYALTTNTHLGIWYAHSGAAAAFTSANNNHLYANGGGVGAIGSVPGAPPKSVVMRWAVNADTREVWVRRSDLPSWVGGGDPEEGTSPSFVLGGDGPIYPAAGIGSDGGDPGDAWTDLLTESEQVGDVPDGFTNYMAETAPPSGAIEGTASVAFSTIAAPSGESTIQIAGATSVGFAAALAQDVPYFGNTTPGIGGTWSGNAGRIIASRFELTEPASTLTFYQHFGYNADDSGNDPGGVDWVGMVFADDAGEPGDVVAVSQVATSTGAGRWQPATLSAQLEPGFYWLGTQAASFSLTINTTTPAEGGTIGNIRRAEGSSLAIEPGDPWPGTASTAPGDLTAYVIYSPLPPPSQIEGASSVGFAASAAPSALGALAGAASVSFISVAAPEASARITGAALLDFAARAAPSTRVAREGATSVSFSTAASLSAAGALAGAASLSFASAAEPGSSTAAAGAAQVSFGAHATPAATVALAGAASVSLAAAASPGSGAALAGAARVSFASTASPSARAERAGAASVIFGASARPTTAGALAGAARISFAAGALADAVGALAGASTISFAASAQPTVAAALAGRAALSFDTAATPDAPGRLLGRAALSFDARAWPAATVALTARAGLTFDAAAWPAASAPLAGSASLSFDATAEPDAPGRIRGRAGLDFAAGGQLTAAATLSAAARVAFTASATPQLAGQLAGRARLTLAASAQPHALASAAGRASIAFALTGEGHYSGRINGRASVAFTTAADRRAAAALTGATGLAFRTWLYSTDAFDCPPHVVVLPPFPELLVVALTDDGLAPVALSEPEFVVVLEDEHISVTRGCD